MEIVPPRKHAHNTRESGDFDGDDDVDLAVAMGNSEDVLAMLNRGDRNTADGDGDGDPDILATNWDSIGVWLNDGNGNFGTSGAVPAGVEHVNSLTVGDAVERFPPAGEPRCRRL